MTARRDATLVAYLRANKIIDPAQVSAALAHQTNVMPTSSIGQVLLHLRFITQEALAAASRAIDASIERDNAANAVAQPVDTLTRAVGDARSTSEELAEIAKKISEELKRE